MFPREIVSRFSEARVCEPGMGGGTGAVPLPQKKMNFPFETVFIVDRRVNRLGFKLASLDRGRIAASQQAAALNQCHIIFVAELPSLESRRN